MLQLINEVLILVYHSVKYTTFKRYSEFTWFEFAVCFPNSFAHLSKAESVSVTIDLLTINKKYISMYHIPFSVSFRNILRIGGNAQIQVLDLFGFGAFFLFKTSELSSCDEVL